MPKKRVDCYIVKISEMAFLDMCLGALEAYAVHPINKNEDEELPGPIETYGIIWGSEKRLKGKTLYTVEKISIDTSANGNLFSCYYNPDSLKLKSDFVSSFMPNLEFLGDFHTHPYLKQVRGVRQNNLFEFSKTDIKSIKAFNFQKYDYRVGLVITLACGNQQSGNFKCKYFDNDRSVIEIQISNYYIWIQSYVVYLTPLKRKIKVSKKHITLVVPSVQSIDELYKPFGRYNAMNNLHQLC